MALPRRNTTSSPAHPSTGRGAPARPGASRPSVGGVRQMFGYRPRTAEQVKARQDQSGGNYAKILVPNIPPFTPEDGTNKIRFIPALWEGATHYGYDVWVHYSIGPNKDKFLCAKMMLGEACPLCEMRSEEYARPEEDQDKDLLKAFRPTKRVAVWVINRKKPEAGPLLWLMPKGVDEDISKISFDQDTGELLLVDDPEAGYDVTFTKTGTGLNTDYAGKVISRRSTPLSEDPEQLEAWSKYCRDNSIPSLLVFADYDTIFQCVTGQTPGRAERSSAEYADESQEAEAEYEEEPESPEGEDSVEYEEGAEAEPEPEQRHVATTATSSVKDRLKKLGTRSGGRG